MEKIEIEVRKCTSASTIKNFLPYKNLHLWKAYYVYGMHKRVAQWLATCAWKPKVPGLSLATNSVQM